MHDGQVPLLLTQDFSPPFSDPVIRDTPSDSDFIFPLKNVP